MSLLVWFLVFVLPPCGGGVEALRDGGGVSLNISARSYPPPASEALATSPTRGEVRTKALLRNWIL